MHVQVVTFELDGITEEQYHRTCEQATGTFASQPGLLAKLWLRSPESGIYGGVYLWRDREAFERYVAGDVFASIGSDPALKGARSVDYAVFDDLTKATQPEVMLV